MGDGVAVSLDVDITGREFSSEDRADFDYDNGQAGDVDEWRTAISRQVGGDVVIVWANDESPLFSFVARTVRVGGEERVICGQCTPTPDGIETRVDLDRPMAPIVQKAAPSRRMAM